MDEWPVAAVFWLDHTRDAAIVLLDDGLDHVRAAPTVSALVATNLIVLVLWIFGMSRLRAAEREVAARRADLSALAESCEKETRWRIANANVEARIRNTSTVTHETGSAEAAASSRDLPGASGAATAAA